MNLTPAENNTFELLYELLTISVCWLLVAPVIFICTMVAIPAVVIWGLLVSLFDWFMNFFEKSENELD